MLSCELESFYFAFPSCISLRIFILYLDFNWTLSTYWYFGYVFILGFSCWIFKAFHSGPSGYTFIHFLGIFIHFWVVKLCWWGVFLVVPLDMCLFWGTYVGLLKCLKHHFCYDHCFLIIVSQFFFFVISCIVDCWEGLMHHHNFTMICSMAT